MRVPFALSVRAVIVVALLDLGAVAATSPKPQPLMWAYPFVAKQPPDSAPSGKLYTIPGSALKLTAEQADDPFNPPDWKPADHPSMPTVVAHGRKPDIYACGLCHLTNGQGTHGSVNLAGLSSRYIIQQVQEMKSGRRRSADLRRPGMQLMVNVAIHASASDIEEAAAYFSRLHFRPWIRVVETRSVPRTRAAYWGWLDAIPHGELEPIGQRIIELAEDRRRAGLYDPASGFVAYVPVGSLKRGEALVLNGSSATNPCGSCHGEDLRGVGDVPSLAGRCPSYLARQLWDIKSGSRGGPAVALMRAPVAQLSEADIVDITAYLASRHP